MIRPLRSFRSQTMACIGMALLVIADQPPAAAAKVYRCQAEGGKVDFQDKPCADGARETMVKVETDTASDPGKPVKLRPYTSLSEADKKLFDRLAHDYAAMFEPYYRLVRCEQFHGSKFRVSPDDNQRRTVSLERLRMELTQRFGDSAGVIMMMGAQKPSAEEPSLGACNSALREIGSVRHPRVPDTLILRPGEMLTRILREDKLATGVLRFIETRPAEGQGTPKYQIVHRDQTVLESSEPVGYDRLIGGPTPVLLVGKKATSTQCRHGGHVSFHAITLPAQGTHTVTPLKTDCLTPQEFGRGQPPGICFAQGQEAGIPSVIFTVGSDGTLISKGTRCPGVCPSSDKPASDAKMQKHGDCNVRIYM